MITNLIFIEHPLHVESLYPFSILHLPWELRLGAYTIAEAWELYLGAHAIGFIGRRDHVESFLARNPRYSTQQLGVGKLAILSSRLLPSINNAEQITTIAQSDQPLIVLIAGDEIVGIVCEYSHWEKFAVTKWDQLKQHSLLHRSFVYEIQSSQLLNHIWDLFDICGEALKEQVRFFIKSDTERDIEVSEMAALLCPESIIIGGGTTISPFVVLDASKGPIIIGENVAILPQSTICGPCVVGNNSIVRAGSRIYPNTVIGPWCKVGGEIECSIFQGYSNKQHDGFMGHSFISEWVNIGANTITSNLKNTYRPITISLPSRSVSTGRIFLGLLCGDHTKTGINTMISTGTVVGVCTNIFGEGYTPVFVPSFTWGAIKQNKHYGIESALDVARRAMARRGRSLLFQEEKLLRSEYERVVLTGHVTIAQS